MQPQSSDEKLIWLALVGTYGFYLLGALFVLAPVLGWVLAGRHALRWWRSTPSHPVGIPSAIWVWIICMLVMELALLVAHFDYALGIGPMIKSSVGWAKGWALLALFMVAGLLPIRMELLARASCILSAQTLLLLPLLFLAYLLHLPQELYVSPISVIGGPGPEFFSVTLYGINPDNGLPRWRLFTPWAPALGMVANIYFFLALRERDRVWRTLGIIGPIVMILVSGSRLGLLAMPIVLLLSVGLGSLQRPIMWYLAAFIASVAGLLFEPILHAIEWAEHRFTSARAESSRVRATLGRIALDRWSGEAPIWGHGTVERGPHIVEHMPIGSHHTWYGLLFVKGAVGFLALAVAMLWSLVVLGRHAASNADARTGLQMTLVLLLYTFGENLEILAYLYWPGVVAMGIAFRQIAALPARAQPQPIRLLPAAQETAS